MSVLLTGVYVHHACALYLRTLEEGTGFLKAGVTVVSCVRLNPGPLEEHWAHFTSEFKVHSLIPVFLNAWIPQNWS